MSPKGERHPLQLLTDIEGAIADIREAETLLDATAEHSVEARVAHNAILYALVVIGEAVNALPDELLDTEPEIPWRRIVDMRNYLAHQYFDVSIDLVRDTIDEPLADLEAACGRLRSRLEQQKGEAPQA